MDYIKRLLRIEQAKAKERQGERTSASNNAEVKRSDDATAKQFDMSATTMRRELFIADNADMLDPADFADWDEGKLSTNKAYQRIKAAKEQAEHELRIEITENELRKEFTWTERLEYARRLERIESINAKGRMLVGKAINPSANLREGRTDVIVAAQLGTSATQLRKAQAIADNADLLDPADFADWDEGIMQEGQPDLACSFS